MGGDRRGWRASANARRGSGGSCFGFGLRGGSGLVGDLGRVRGSSSFLGLRSHDGLSCDCLELWLLRCCSWSYPEARFYRLTEARLRAYCKIHVGYR